MATIYKRGGKGNRGGRYYISYFDHKGKRQSHSARTTDKATAERIAAKLEADAALRRDGVVDPNSMRSANSPAAVESHVKDYEAKMGRPIGLRSTSARRSPTSAPSARTASSRRWPTSRRTASISTQGC